MGDPVQVLEKLMSLLRIDNAVDRSEQWGD
jgi:hypothetical protein